MNPTAPPPRRRRAGPHRSAGCAGAPARRNPPPPGGRWHVRRIGPEGRPAVLRHLLALDPADRVRRFGHAVSDAWLSEHAARLDFERDAVFAVVAGRSSRGVLIAVAHLRHAATDAGELAVSVLPDWRCRGLGQALCAAAIAEAERAGFGRIECPSGDEPGFRLVRALGCTVLAGGRSGARLLLPRPAAACA